MERFMVVALTCVRCAVVNNALRQTEIDSGDLSHSLDRLDDVAATMAEHPDSSADVAGLPIRDPGVIDDLGEGNRVEHAGIFSPQLPGVQADSPVTHLLQAVARPLSCLYRSSVSARVWADGLLLYSAALRGPSPHYPPGSRPF